jgi:hypothetical protein
MRSRRFRRTLMTPPDTPRSLNYLRHKRGQRVPGCLDERAEHPAQSTSQRPRAHQGCLAGATKSLAIEYASRGIRVNALSPGIIQTPVHPAESYAGLGARLPPVGHVGQVSDIVDAILFLESSTFIIGEILHVDGDQIAGH